MRFQAQPPGRCSQIRTRRCQQREIQRPGIIGPVQPHLARISNGQIIAPVGSTLHPGGHSHPTRRARILIVGDLCILICIHHWRRQPSRTRRIGRIRTIILLQTGPCPRRVPHPVLGQRILNPRKRAAYPASVCHREGDHKIIGVGIARAVLTAHVVAVTSTVHQPSYNGRMRCPSCATERVGHRSVGHTRSRGIATSSNLIRSQTQVGLAGSGWQRARGLSIHSHRRHRCRIRIERSDRTVQPAAAPTVRSDATLHPSMRNRRCRQLIVQLNHVRGPHGLIPRDPQSILRLECWGAAQHQRRNEIEIEICLCTEVQG